MSKKMANILIVDDEVTSIEVMRCLLETNVNTQVAETGQKALELLEKNDFDLVLLDVDLLANSTPKCTTL
ncbi:response regulator [Marinomonas pollencensis]|uniref:Response regulator receiver domain-containing protein n=1 Tax=Marinomonas pollencensis TaxID=491954 RepID=A0A3E0D8G9_9GAMM|nr:response regulator [Marinomonas pollencensis]REG78241.1 response regulator receiver domain-containing protein [Marinomonas pollencensis]